MSLEGNIQATVFIIGVAGGFTYSLKLLNSLYQDFKRWHYEYREKQRKEQDKVEEEKQQFKNLLIDCNKNLSTLTTSVSTIAENIASNIKCCNNNKSDNNNRSNIYNSDDEY
jgi:hypothetical protein